MNKQPKPNEQVIKNKKKHETHFACQEMLDKYGDKTIGCCCTIHNCTPPSSPLEEKILEKYLHYFTHKSYIGGEHLEWYYSKPKMQDIKQFISEVIEECRAKERDKFIDLVKRSADSLVMVKKGVKVTRGAVFAKEPMVSMKELLVALSKNL